MASTPASQRVKYRCPDCLGELVAAAESLRCAGCAREYPIVDGIAMLRGNSATYYGEFTQAQMQELLRRSREDLPAALAACLRETQSPPRLGEYIVGAGRAGWKFLLPIRPDAAVLDLGCGWGTLAHSFAQSCAAVVAMDSTLERMQLLALRGQQDQLASLQCLCAGDGRHLPFDDQTFDIVIVNGVLEWVPASMPGDAREVQLALLREIRRVLRNSGTLFLAIENRYAWKTWFRQPDGHCNLRFVPWLPRKLANLYSRLWGNGAYRTYLYGRRQYDKLFRDAGFAATEFHVPLPGYHHPVALAPADDRAQISSIVARPQRSAPKQLKQQLKGWLTARFPDAFAMIATGDDRANSFLQRVVTMLQPTGGSIAAYRINGEMGMVTAVIEAAGDDRSHDLVVRLPLHQRARDEIEHEARCLAAAQTELNPLAPLLPRVLYSGVFDGQYVAAFSRLAGIAGDRLVADDQILERAADFAIELHHLTRQPTPADPAEIRERLSDYHRQVSRVASSTAQQRDLDALCARLAAAWTRQPVHLVIAHGDFKLANCLFDRDSRALTGVIDWGAGFGHDLPIYDLTFLLADHAAKGAGGIANLLKLWLRGERSADQAKLAAWAARLNLDMDNLFAAAAGYQWLKRMVPLSSGYEARRFDYRFIDAMFDAIANA